MEDKRPIIVAIDDYPDNLVTVKAFVTDAFPEAQIFSAGNGIDGINLVREKNPDVVLLDIVMPEMDGFEVCSLLKKDPHLQYIPVIFLTAQRDDRKSRIHALEVGGEVFISKPFEEAEFIAQIKAMMKIKAAYDRERQEKKSLEDLVAQRTNELEKELHERRRSEEELSKANLILQQNRVEMLNLLEDLKDEVDARKKAEEDLREKELYYTAILDNLPIGVAVNSADPDVNFFYMNDTYPLNYRTTRDQLAGTDMFWDVVYQDPEFRDSLKKRVLDDCASGDKDRMYWTDIPIKRRGEETSYISVRNIPIPDNHLMVSLVWDITRQKLAEMTLQEREGLLKTVVTTLNGVVFSVDKDGTFLLSEGRSLSSLGLVPGQVVGQSVFDIYKDIPEMTSGMESVLDGASWSGTIRIQDMVFDAVVSPIFDEEQQVKGAVGFASDVTERTLIEDTQLFLTRSDYLQTGEDFFHILARYLAKTLDMDYVCIDRLEGDLLSARTVAVYFDGEFEDNVTYTLKDTPCGDVVGKRICIFPHGVRHRFQKDIVLQDMSAESYVGTTLWGFDGEPIGLIAVIGRKPLVNPAVAESILHLVGIRAAGELERTMGEEKLRESNELFSQFMRYSPIYTFIKTVTPTESRVLHVSDNFEQMIGIPGKEMIGKRMDELFPAEFAVKMTADDWNVIANGEVLKIIEHLGDRNYMTLKFPVIQGTRTFLGGYTIDITDRLRAEEALHAANHKLHLLTSLTRHDIFNQVSAVQLLLEMAEQSPDIVKIHEYVSRAQTVTTQIEATIGFTREYENFGTSSSGWHQIYQIIETAQTEVALGEVTITNQIPTDLEIFTDPIIRKVFTNLMENAIRHGESIKEIRFFCMQDGYQLIISGKDDGVGIPAEEKSRIFEHGYGKHTGIGLYIAREILSITGLSIRETGVYGEGAWFEILVPAGKYRFVEKK